MERATCEFRVAVANLDERERLVRDLGARNAMVLRNLGLLAAGEPAAKAFHEIYMLERACQAHIQAMVGGARLIVPGADVSGRTARQFEMDSSSGIIEIARNAALRLIEDSRP